MPPKPRPVRKSSATSNAPTTALAAKDAPAPSASTSMPPPPVPVPPLGILEAEVTALSQCLQNAVVKTGQVYGFYTDVKRLGIQQYAPRPPRSLMSSLGREIVKYDQLCDAMESHLLRAITVLQRDLAREEQRIKAEEEAAAAAAAAARASSPTAASVTTPPASPTPSTQTDVPMDGTMRPRLTTITPARRQSTISLSSLSRPAFPHKLDLSASALRIHPDEMIPSGLSSPVTLAPRSARASLPPDLVMAALGDAANRPVDIDLTLDVDMDMAGPSNDGQVREMVPLDPTLGNSADKPIELDLDMDMEYFGHAAQAASGGADNNLFRPDAGLQMVKPKEEQIDMDILSSFPSVEHAGDGEDIFAGLGDATAGAGDAPATAPSVSDLQKGPASAPSPGTILAGLAAGTSHPGDGASAAASAEPGQGASFDFDMSTLGDNFFAQPATGGDMDMIGMGVDDIFNMGVDPSEGGASGSVTGTSGTS
ncbi:hypothetical protein L227DRAFT_550749 [Lentinus tigrinus ALCF2SS1-6]|uniref:Uncharacterized protein n=1 Tax=Lentinus tigrinus ALCF2SS1-6 TaxID=1328759 RepID=A0A5C2S5W2_9APHY|nr:hypothetical protein L227DRAFT_550749 [Lentinus tigrinus ALCF2SS1-6]